MLGIVVLLAALACLPAIAAALFLGQMRAETRHG
jgi:hypothetical protein